MENCTYRLRATVCIYIAGTTFVSKDLETLAEGYKICENIADAKAVCGGPLCAPFVRVSLDTQYKDSYCWGYACGIDAANYEGGASVRERILEEYTKRRSDYPGGYPELGEEYEGFRLKDGEIPAGKML